MIRALSRLLLRRALAAREWARTELIIFRRELRAFGYLLLTVLDHPVVIAVFALFFIWLSLLVSR